MRAEAQRQIDEVSARAAEAPYPTLEETRAYVYAVEAVSAAEAGGVTEMTYREAVRAALATSSPATRA